MTRESPRWSVLYTIEEFFSNDACCFTWASKKSVILGSFSFCLPVWCAHLTLDSAGCLRGSLIENVAFVFPFSKCIYGTSVCGLPGWLGYFLLYFFFLSSTFKCIHANVSFMCGCSLALTSAVQLLQMLVLSDDSVMGGLAVTRWVGLADLDLALI